METRTLHEQRMEDDPTVERDVTLDRDTRDALEEIAEILEGRCYMVDAGIVRRIVRDWDEATS